MLSPPVIPIPSGNVECGLQRRTACQTSTSSFPSRRRSPTASSTAVAALPGVRVGVVSQEPLERMPPAVAAARSPGTGGWGSCFDPQQLAEGVRGLARQIGAPDRLLGVLEQLQVPLGAVRERSASPGMGVAGGAQLPRQGADEDVLRAAGLPCARHRLADERRGAVWSSPSEVGLPAGRQAAGGRGRQGHLPPRRGASSSRRRWRSDPPRAAAALVVEEFVVGDEHSFDAVSIGGRPVWHSLTHYLPTPLEVLRNPWIQWCVLLPREVDDPRYDDIRGAGFRALEALGMGTGLAHMEWFRRKDGSRRDLRGRRRARPGAQITTLISYAHDFDFYAAWARLVVFERVRRRRRAATRRAPPSCAARARGASQAVHGLEQAQREMGAPRRRGRSSRAAASRRSASYEGEGYVILRHPETGWSSRRCSELISSVRVEVA